MLHIGPRPALHCRVTASSHPAPLANANVGGATGRVDPSSAAPAKQSGSAGLSTVSTGSFGGTFGRLIRSLTTNPGAFRGEAPAGDGGDLPAPAARPKLSAVLVSDSPNMAGRTTPTPDQIARALVQSMLQGPTQSVKPSPDFSPASAVLPTLPQLAIPPQTVSAPTASAATGETSAAVESHQARRTGPAVDSQERDSQGPQGVDGAGARLPALVLEPNSAVSAPLTLSIPGVRRPDRAGVVDRSNAATASPTPASDLRGLPVRPTSMSAASGRASRTSLAFALRLTPVAPPEGTLDRGTKLPRESSPLDRSTASRDEGETLSRTSVNATSAELSGPVAPGEDAPAASPATGTDSESVGSHGNSSPLSPCSELSPTSAPGAAESGKTSLAASIPVLPAETVVPVEENSSDAALRVTGLTFTAAPPTAVLKASSISAEPAQSPEPLAKVPLDPGITPRTATAPRQSSAIAMRIASPGAPPVEVQLTDRSGQVHVAVRTADPALQNTLRRDLGTLVDSLERAGFKTQAITPGNPASGGSSASAPSSGSRSGQSNDGDQWGQSAGQNGGRNQQQPRQPRSGQRGSGSRNPFSLDPVHILANQENPNE